MSVIRRICPQCEAARAIGGVRLDRSNLVWTGGALRLSPLGQRLIAALLPVGRVASRRALIDALWGDDRNGGPDDANSALSVHVHYLRRLLAKAGAPVSIRTATKSGYELTPL